MVAEQARPTGTSRHRSPSRFPLPAPVGRRGAVLTPVLSLLPSVVLLAVVQSLGPAAQRIPSGAARFDLAAAWLATVPGALAGSASWFPGPTLGRLQLGLLLRVVQGVETQGVLAAAHGAMLLLTVLQAVLLWLALRRLGTGAVAAGLATAVFGVAPLAVDTHATVSAMSVAAGWLLVALCLGLRRGTVPLVLCGAAAAVAVASVPAVAVAAVPLAVLLALRLRRTTEREGVRPLFAAAAGFGGTAVLLAGIVAGVAALPRTAATGRFDALVAAQQAVPAFGAAALDRWAVVDPLFALIAVGAVVLAGFAGGHRGTVVLVVVLLAASVWPWGREAIDPSVLLLPVVAAAVARSVDVGLAALGHPLFVRSVLGSAWLTGVAALLLVATVSWLLGLSTLVPGRAQPVAQLGRWIGSSVPPGQTVLVGLGVWPDLVSTTRAEIGWYAGAAGRTAVPSSVPWRTADYIVEDASLRSVRTGPATEALGRSVEVASFGSGASAMAVRAVRASAAPTAPPATAAGRAAARLRIAVGRQLAQNPRIEMGGRDRARLRSGEVDTRIALVLAQFVTAHRILIGGFGVADGDATGIRTSVTISGIDGRRVPSDGTKTGVLLRFLSDLRGDLRVRTIDATDDGITAAFAPDPDLIPGG